MKIQPSRVGRKYLLNATADELALRGCRSARRLEERGEYEAAAERLEGLWGGVGTYPRVTELAPLTQAEVLLRAGSLTGWLGGERQIAGAQDAAKDLLGESLTLFASLGMWARVGETQTEMAYCYWREGSFSEAKVLLDEALAKPLGAAQKAVAIIRLSIVLWSESKFKEAIDLLITNGSLFEDTESDSIKGRFHIGLASFYFHYATSENLEEYLDKALIEYEAARFYFEQARHRKYLGVVENQLGLIFIEKGHYAPAHLHLKLARKVFRSLKDRTHTAQVEESIARAFLGEGDNRSAELRALQAVGILRGGEARAELSEALLTLATAQARSGRVAHAAKNFEEAVEVAEQGGAKERAAAASVRALEELMGKTPTPALEEFMDHAAANATVSNDPQIKARWERVAERFRRQWDAERASRAEEEGDSVVSSNLILPPEEKIDWAGFSLGDLLVRVEEFFIEAALNRTGGNIKRASLLLGMSHHESLRHRVIKKYPHLAELTHKPVRKRLKSIIKKK